MEGKNVMTTIEELEARLRALVPGPFGSLYLSFNGENGYQTVEQRSKVEEDFAADWISDEEMQKAVATNSMWVLNWYPKGEVSSYRIAASSLAALLDAAEQEK